MPDPIRLVTVDEKATNNVVERLESLLVEARLGKIPSMMILVQYPDEFKYSRTNLSIENAICHLSRVMHRLHLEWDRQ